MNCENTVVEVFRHGFDSNLLHDICFSLNLKEKIALAKTSKAFWGRREIILKETEKLQMHAKLKEWTLATEEAMMKGFDLDVDYFCTKSGNMVRFLELAVKLGRVDMFQKVVSFANVLIVSFDNMFHT
jgi:hypothetical protein